MGVTAASLGALIQSELAGLKDRRVLEHIGGPLIPPSQHLREWC